MHKSAKLNCKGGPLPKTFSNVQVRACGRAGPAVFEFWPPSPLTRRRKKKFFLPKKT